VLDFKLTAKEKKVVKRAAAQYRRISRHELPKPVLDHPDSMIMELTPDYSTDRAHKLKYHQLVDEVYRLVGANGDQRGKMGQGHIRKKYEPAIPRRLDARSREAIVSMYEGGASVRSIQSAIECGTETVYLVLRKAGVTLRRAKDGPWSKT